MRNSTNIDKGLNYGTKHSDTQHNDTQPRANQHNDTQHNVKLSVAFLLLYCVFVTWLSQRVRHLSNICGKNTVCLTVTNALAYCEERQ